MGWQKIRQCGPSSNGGLIDGGGHLELLCLCVFKVSRTTLSFLNHEVHVYKSLKHGNACTHTCTHAPIMVRTWEKHPSCLRVFCLHMSTPFTSRTKIQLEIYGRKRGNWNTSKVGHSKTNLCKTLHKLQQNVDFSHIKSSGSSHMCEVNFMASSITIMEFFFTFLVYPHWQPSTRLSNQIWLQDRQESKISL